MCKHYLPDATCAMANTSRILALKHSEYWCFKYTPLYSPEDQICFNCTHYSLQCQECKFSLPMGSVSSDKKSPSHTCSAFFPCSFEVKNLPDFVLSKIEKLQRNPKASRTYISYLEAVWSGRPFGAKLRKIKECL